MTGLELTAKIYAKEIENGTRIKMTATSGYTANLTFERDRLNWETGKFDTAFLFSKNANFEIVEEKKGWFKPKYGEKYWFIDYDGDIYSDNFDSGFFGDEYKLQTHNCFRSEEEAREYLEYKKALRKAEKPFVVGKDNWYIIFDTLTSKLCFDWNTTMKKQGVTYLGTDKEVAQAFIAKWKECILKYEFDIWE